MLIEFFGGGTKGTDHALVLAFSAQRVYDIYHSWILLTASDVALAVTTILRFACPLQRIIFLSYGVDYSIMPANKVRHSWRQ